MKNNLLKAVSVTLLISMLSAFSACSKDSSTVESSSDSAPFTGITDNGTDSDAPVNEFDMYYPDADGIDLNGVDFNLLYFSNLLTFSWMGIPTDMNPVEETGDVLNDAVYNRNRNIEDMPVTCYIALSVISRKKEFLDLSVFDVPFIEIVSTLIRRVAVYKFSLLCKPVFLGFGKIFFPKAVS